MDQEKTTWNELNDGRPERMEAEAYIALGSNMGNREDLLTQAMRLMDQNPDIAISKGSCIYETAPVGYLEQPAFLNMAAAVRTTLSPLSLLHTLLELEQRLGRVRHQRWGPRTIDLDLLLYNDVILDQEELTLPHPRMMERSFVLVPLREVLAPSHPLQRQVEENSDAALQVGKDGISLWKTINWRNALEPLES